MHVKSKPSWHIPDSEVTPKALYANRRQIIKTMGFGGAIAASGLFPAHRARAELNYKAAGGPPEGDPLTSHEAITTYNNFYEFGTDKDDPAEYAYRMPIDPWQVVIEGEVAKPKTWGLEDFLNRTDLEERIYRHRCVEAWSMVIPWIGFPLAGLIKEVEPTSRAKFVQFETLLDRKNMPGTRYPVLDWPYVEGLRIDEAMNPLAILAVGLYGDNLPKQNGAPIRLVVPWKYGFKSIKSIVAIRFVEDQPGTSWSIATPNEYGFYSNVNPEVDHPRWSQKTERRIGEFRRRKTLKFNGYGDEVAYLYAGMDLKKYF